MNKQTDTFPTGETPLLLPGAIGPLEAIATTSTITPLHNITAVICHPHPQQEGTMHNKVVTTLHRACRDLGVRTVRFNYRGVGQSEGTFGHAIGEADDALAIIDWVGRVRPDDKLWLLGFSFGAGVVLQAQAQARAPHRIDYLVCVAPGVDRDYFSNTTPHTCPWLVVQGGADEVVDSTKVMQWVQGIGQNPPQYALFADVGHFFHGKLVLLRDTVHTALLQHIADTNVS